MRSCTYRLYIFNFPTVYSLAVWDCGWRKGMKGMTDEGVCEDGCVTRGGSKKTDGGEIYYSPSMP